MASGAWNLFIDFVFYWKVERTFQGMPDLYFEFVRILKDYHQAQEIEVPKIVDHLFHLFHEHKHLILVSACNQSL